MADAVRVRGERGAPLARDVPWSKQRRRSEIRVVMARVWSCKYRVLIPTTKEKAHVPRAALAAPERAQQQGQEDRPLQDRFPVRPDNVLASA